MPPIRAMRRHYEPSQVGTLSTEGSEVLPLYASKSFVHRDRYFYHTLTSGYNPIKVPVHFKNRNCLKDDIGCEAVYDEDLVGVPTISGAGHYKVELYESCLH
jgi:hypothetical protein